MSHSTAKKQSSYFKKTQSVGLSVNSAPCTAINPHRHPKFGVQKNVVIGLMSHSWVRCLKKTSP